MKVLFFGDIVGKPGRSAIKKVLPELKKQYDPDLILANGENLAHGKGIFQINIRSKKILLANLIGRVFMQQQFDNPFVCVKEILEDYSLKKESGKEKVSAIIIDWHAEATSEKMAMGWYLDGKVSAVVGTHTHIGTDDARVLPGGTAYVSDVGMVGGENSVLGVDKDIIIKRFLTQMPYHMEVAEGPVLVNAVLITIDDKTGLAQNIEKIKLVTKVDV